MDTMVAAVHETNSTVKSAMTVGPPLGVLKPYLTPMALLTSARAFTDASSASAKNSSDPKVKVYQARVQRARMANMYTVLWRWDELRTFASNLSMAWPMPEVTKETAYAWFANEYNITGTKWLSIDGPSAQGHSGGDLGWLKECLFGQCPTQLLKYAEVVLDECGTAAAVQMYNGSLCRNQDSVVQECTHCEPVHSSQELWTALPSTAPGGGSVFRSALSSSLTCMTLNIPSDLVRQTVPKFPNSFCVIVC
jgi:hypothetical protein